MSIKRFIKNNQYFNQNYKKLKLKLPILYLKIIEFLINFKITKYLLLQNKLFYKMILK